MPQQPWAVKEFESSSSNASHKDVATMSHWPPSADNPNMPGWTSRFPSQSFHPPHPPHPSSMSSSDLFSAHAWCTGISHAIAQPLYSLQSSSICHHPFHHQLKPPSCDICLLSCTSWNPNGPLANSHHCHSSCFPLSCRTAPLLLPCTSLAALSACLSYFTFSLGKSVTLWVFKSI